MKFLKRIGVDGYMLLLVLTAAAGVVLPARGLAAGVLGHATFWAVTLLFFLYGAKLDPAAVRAGLLNLRLQTLTGGQGADQLWGGLGADRFVFLAASDSAPQMRDQIRDFSRAQGDRIDLSAIDADRRDGYDNDAFRYVGTDAFSGAAGELRYGRVAGGVIVQADTNGDRVADMAFLVAGNQALLASDFLL